MSTKAITYIQELEAMMDVIIGHEMEAIQQAADLVRAAVTADGIVYTFGTGHSHVIAEDAAYRAGGLVPVDAILEDSLTGNHKVFQSERMERVEGMAAVILDYYNPKPEDVLIIISNSGRNAAPIEMAVGAQARGLKVVAITSLKHSQGTTSRHSSGKKLFEIADVVIDNQAPRGDCIMSHRIMKQPFGPASGVMGMVILQSIIVAAIDDMAEAGVQPPVFMSGNIDNSEAFNRPLMEKYWGRIKLW
ncbi:MAG: SIS domain-containing protein [Anaerolineales bacterium]|nr:SIS domain-containing protein [Anaerolineales bacterium]